MHIRSPASKKVVVWETQKFFTTMHLGSAFYQVPPRKQDREKTGVTCELGLFKWKRMPIELCNATATFQRLMAQALTKVTKKYGNLIMCYIDDVMIATNPGGPTGDTVGSLYLHGRFVFEVKPLSFNTAIFVYKLFTSLAITS